MSEETIGEWRKKVFPPDPPKKLTEEQREEGAEKIDTPPTVEYDTGRGMVYRPNLEEVDPFGITNVFAQHLAASLQHMHPKQAFEAAQHATRAYLASYDFKMASHKGSTSVQYHMVPKSG